MPSSSLLRSLSPRLLRPLSLLRCYSRYKLVHEKLVAEKQHKLLRHKQLLEEARRRSETRDEVAPSTDSPEPSSLNDFETATLKERAEALTARFVRDASEELRGEGVFRMRASRSDPTSPPLDLRKLVGDRHGRSRRSIFAVRNWGGGLGARNGAGGGADVVFTGWLDPARLQ